jgi:queuine tRNA-ribosyltransferase
MSDFSFRLESQKGHARAGVMHTAHGDALTPMFMPVGTQATVKSLSTEDVVALQPQVVLANTYHLYLRPGHERIARLGGLHEFMHYERPMLTDSGGFQVFSLGEQLAQKGETRLAKAKISEEGVEFTSHLDGSTHQLTPELSIEIQRHLGADIIMAFDECLPDAAGHEYTQESVERTYRWAQRCVTAWEGALRRSVPGHGQALFGIIQGAMHEDLRRRAAQQITSLPLDGLAFGGETIGYNMEGTLQVLDWLREHLPAEKPRYAMGLGREPENIVDAVLAGYDMFDCVAPTRLARNGVLYHGRLEIENDRPVWRSEFPKSRLPIGNAGFAEDQGVILDGCDCDTCSHGYTRAYLHHLYRTQELTYYRLASLHNARLMVRLSEELRHWILRV